MSLSDDEKKQLADYSLMDAFAKQKLLSHVRNTLWSLENTIRDYQNCGNRQRDPQLTKLREDLEKTARSLFGCGDDFLRALGTDPEKYMYDRPGDEIDLLLKEAGLGSMREVEDDGSYWEESLPFEDPLEVYKRNK